MYIGLRKGSKTRNTSPMFWFVKSFHWWADRIAQKRSQKEKKKKVQGERVEIKWCQKICEQKIYKNSNKSSSVPQNSCPRAGSPGTFLPLPPCNYQSGNHCHPLSRLDASLGPILFESYVDKEALGQELWWLAMKSVLLLIPLLLNVSIQITRSTFVPTCSYPSSQRFGSSL